VDADTVLAMFKHVRQQWPGADVQASTLEQYLDGLTAALQEGGLSLPVVTGTGSAVVFCCVWLMLEQAPANLVDDSRLFVVVCMDTRTQ
jgi:hypothetical protein